MREKSDFPTDLSESVIVSFGRMPPESVQVFGINFLQGGESDYKISYVGRFQPIATGHLFIRIVSRTFVLP